MPITYYDLGPDKALNSIVMAGSHDAGITGGGGNVQTQHLDIYGQSQAGVRIFDLRIAAATVAGKTGGVKNAKLKSFHADPKVQSVKTTQRNVPGFGVREIERTKLRGGAFGMSLTRMLREARQFVTDHASEFLILKFDKSTNWPMVAQSCVDVLDDSIYTGGGNLNTKSLNQLAGRVIVCFTPTGAAEAAAHNFGPADGILAIKNLYSGGAYNPYFQGLQYFGKGGTSPFNAINKIGQNKKKQTKIIEKAGDGNPNVMGMMYWTTTGLTENIRRRNDGMWTPPNVQRMQTIWKQGLKHAIESRINHYIDINGTAAGHVIKAFMPNFVMIDFADAQKCSHIFELNAVPVTFLIDQMNQYYPAQV